VIHEARVHGTAQLEYRYAMAAGGTSLKMDETRASNTVKDDEYALADEIVGEPAFQW
jgi:hypothetical protein